MREQAENGCRLFSLFLLLSIQVKQHEADNWTECLKSFGSLPDHRYILAKDAGHKVWEDNPNIVIDEVIGLY